MASRSWGRRRRRHGRRRENVSNGKNKTETKSTDDHSKKFSTSSSFLAGESAGIHRVLTELKSHEQSKLRSGLNSANFSIGVLNCFLVLYVFGAYPQHSWLLYLIESLILYPIKIRHFNQSKPLNEILFFMDYCWVVNFLGGLVLLTLVITAITGISSHIHLSDNIRTTIFLIFFGQSSGPLIGAALGLNFIKLLFHDIGNMTSIFIHVYPPMLLYNLRWDYTKVQEAWPSIFGPINFNQSQILCFPSRDYFWGTLIGSTFGFYFIWLCLYTVWLVSIGMDLPRNPRRTLQKDGTPAPAIYDTIFHCNMRDGATLTFGKWWNRPEEVSKDQNARNDFEMRDCFLYLIIHLHLAILIISFSVYPCFVSQGYHGFVLMLVLVACTYRGSTRYTYFSTEMFSSLIQKTFTAEIDRNNSYVEGYGACSIVSGLDALEENV